MLLKQSVGVKVTLEFHFIAVGFWVFRIARVLRFFIWQEYLALAYKFCGI